MALQRPFLATFVCNYLYVNELYFHGNQTYQHFAPLMEWNAQSWVNKDVIDLSVDYLHCFALAIVLSTLFKA